MQHPIDEQFCFNHPTTPTSLRCSKCERPICQKCIVRTQVGMRCPDCAGVQRTRAGTFYVPTILTQVSGKQYAFATLAGLGVAIIGGIGWGQWASWEGLPWAFWWVLIITLVAGEAIGRVTNERRGRGLQLLAAGSVLVAAVIAFFWQYLVVHDFPLDAFSAIVGQPGGWEYIGLTVSNAFFVILGMFVATRRLEV